MLPVSFHTPGVSAAASGSVAVDAPIANKAAINKDKTFIRCIRMNSCTAVWENP